MIPPRNTRAQQLIAKLPVLNNPYADADMVYVARMAVEAKLDEQERQYESELAKQLQAYMKELEK